DLVEAVGVCRLRDACEVDWRPGYGRDVDIGIDGEKVHLVVRRAFLVDRPTECPRFLAAEPVMVHGCVVLDERGLVDHAVELCLPSGWVRALDRDHLRLFHPTLRSRPEVEAFQCRFLALGGYHVTKHWAVSDHALSVLHHVLLHTALGRPSSLVSRWRIVS